MDHSHPPAPTSRAFPLTGHAVFTALENRFGTSVHSPVMSGRLWLAAHQALRLPRSGTRIPDGQVITPTHTDKAAFMADVLAHVGAG